MGRKSFFRSGPTPRFPFWTREANAMPRKLFCVQAKIRGQKKLQKLSAVENVENIFDAVARMVPVEQINMGPASHR